MLSQLVRFGEREDGAITVDWVVLTAAVVALGTIVYVNFLGPLQHVDSESGQALAGIEIDDLSFD